MGTFYFDFLVYIRFVKIVSCKLIVKTCRDETPRDQHIRAFPCLNCSKMFIHFICNVIEATAVLNRGIDVPCLHDCNADFSVASCAKREKFLCQQCFIALS